MIKCLKKLRRRNEKRRALVVVGAGASVEFGIPATVQFNRLIDAGITKSSYCSSVGGIDVYCDVKKTLESYYGDTNEAHFERIYHVMHELSMLEKVTGSVPKYSPVMLPFLNKQKNYTQKALKAACQAMLNVIYEEVSSVCDKPKAPLGPLETFFHLLEKQFIPRVYTTNYDDFISQATQGRYFTGFDQSPDNNYQLFNSKSYWSNWNMPGLFHLHGSIHMGFPLLQTDIELAWYPSKSDAIKRSEFSGSPHSKMDGTGIQRSPIITGLNKLERLQQMPFASYYSGLSRDAIEADIVLILGSGLTDLHLNTWIKEIRKDADLRTPLLYVGYWQGGFYSSIEFESEDRGIALFQDLEIDLSIPESSFKAFDGWTVDANKSGAVWADGFQTFLSRTDGFNRVMKEIGAIR